MMSVCSAGAPTLTLSPSSQSGSAGAGFNYSLTVRNNDTAACLPSVFNVGSAFPAGWTGNVSTSSVQVSAGSSATVGVSLASDVNSVPANYNFSLSVADSSPVHSKGTNGVVTILGADTTAPNAPTQLTAQVKRGQIALKWLAASDNFGVTSYLIFRNGSQIGTSTSTTFTDRSLSAKTTYQYSIKAKDAAGNISASSNTASATTR